jgi:NTP pyrophosphatase (non-canonical NTP hydrolase)
MTPFLKRFRTLNAERAQLFSTTSWTTLELAGAMCGEAGELTNIAKKLRRLEGGCTVNTGDADALLSNLADEAADVLTYLDLICAKHGIDLEAALTKKFNEVSKRVNYPETL